MSTELGNASHTAADRYRNQLGYGSYVPGLDYVLINKHKSVGMQWCVYFKHISLDLRTICWSDQLLFKIDDSNKVRDDIYLMNSVCKFYFWFSDMIY